MPALDSALDLARAGFRVFPLHGIVDGHCTCGCGCGSPGKHPAIAGWQRAATCEEAAVRRLFEHRPNANIGLATGQGLVVIDLDGAQGLATLAGWESEHGRLPETLRVQTGGGGLHLYFKTREALKNSVRLLGPGVDVRAAGGYVVGPGSRHASGQDYTWLDRPAGGAAPLPTFILDRLRGSSEAAGSERVGDEGEALPGGSAPGDPIPEGHRNDALFRYGCDLRAKGHTIAQIDKALREMNAARCVPPLPKEEVVVIRDSIDRFPRGKTAAEEFSRLEKPIVGGLQLVSLADIEYAPPRFLFEPYIPEGAITVIQGNPGDGKTAFAFKLAALLSRGEPLIDKPCEAGGSLLISVEDHPEALRGRFDASGGDPTRALLVRQDQAAGLTFLNPELEDVIKKTHVRLLVFDPLQAFLGAGVDMHRANETRPVLAHLGAIAARTGCAIVLISHLSKASRDSLAIHGALGSVDINASARSVIQIGRSAADPEQRLAVHIKSSGAPQGRSVAFRIGAKGGVAIGGFVEAGTESLLTAGRKARLAAQSFPAEGLITACNEVLERNPEGKKIPYSELNFQWPDGVRPKEFVDALRGRLAQEGIAITTGLRTKTGGAFFIARRELPL